MTSTLRTDIQISINGRDIDLTFKWYDHTTSAALLELNHEYNPIWAEIATYSQDGFEPIHVPRGPIKTTYEGDQIAITEIVCSPGRLMITIAVKPLMGESARVTICVERSNRIGIRILSVTPL